MLSKSQGVESAEVGSAAATTDDDHTVERLVVDTLKGSDDALFYPFALHDGREQLCFEQKTIGVVCQLVTEVAIAGCRLAGDHGDALTEQGELQLFLEVENALGLELTDNLLALARHVAKGVGGINVIDDPREPIGLVKLWIDL